MLLVNIFKCKVYVYLYWFNVLNDILLNRYIVIEVEVNDDEKILDEYNKRLDFWCINRRFLEFRNIIFFLNNKIKM